MDPNQPLPPKRALLRKLSVLCYAQGFTLWHYNDTEILPAQIFAESFFCEFVGMVSSGDMIIVSFKDGATIVHATASERDIVVQRLLA
jgi:hypothetical protein